MSWTVILLSERNSTPNWSSGWYVADGMGASCKVDTKKQAYYLCHKLNEIKIGGQNGDFSKKCDEILEEFSAKKAKVKSRKPTAVVFISGGVVQMVVVNDQRLDVLVVDFDVDGDRPSKKSMDGSPCNLDKWNGSDPNRLNQRIVKYWQKKARMKP
jgi:hypothetical protein